MELAATPRDRSFQVPQQTLHSAFKAVPRFGAILALVESLPNSIIPKKDRHSNGSSNFSHSDASKPREISVLKRFSSTGNLHLLASPFAIASTKHNSSSLPALLPQEKIGTSVSTQETSSLQASTDDLVSSAPTLESSSHDSAASFASHSPETRDPFPSAASPIPSQNSGTPNTSLEETSGLASDTQPLSSVHSSLRNQNTLSADDSVVRRLPFEKDAASSEHNSSLADQPLPPENPDLVHALPTPLTAPLIDPNTQSQPTNQSYGLPSTPLTTNKKEEKPPTSYGYNIAIGLIAAVAIGFIALLFIRSRQPAISIKAS